MPKEETSETQSFSLEESTHSSIFSQEISNFEENYCETPQKYTQRNINKLKAELMNIKTFF